MRANPDTTPASRVAIDVTTPRSLESPVIKADTTGTIVAAALWGTLALAIAVFPVCWFDWVTFGFCVIADAVLLVVVARILIQWPRVRRVWRHGTLVEATVRKSFVAWKDFSGGACTIELELADGSAITFDYPRGQRVGASFPALVHDGWILVVFDVDTIALERLPQSRVSK